MVIAALASIGLASAAGGQGLSEFALPTPNSNPFGIAAGPDGALWFTEVNTNKIGRITTAGVITEFTIPTPDSEPVGIAAGPDGNLWFIEDRNRIGRITTAGAITEFTVGTVTSFLWSIAAGPDGNLWFAYESFPTSPDEPLIGKIGRITTAGVITEYTIPTRLSSPTGITAAPDGALWFTEAGSSKIGRITTDGVITEFTLPSSSTPVGIAAGSDGNLWFTERILFNGELSVGRIGRITTGGAITEFVFPTAGNDPSGIAGIAAGPDGSLWFTENFVNKIGRITTAGVITEATLPSTDSFSSGPLGVAAGPDGNIWFAEHFANKIGRISLASCALSEASLCLHNFRFRAEATWSLGGAGGSGQAVTLTQDAGYLWFFSPDNPEIVVKFLDGCGVNNRTWLFAAGLTNAQVSFTVTDTRTGQVKAYANPSGTAFAPILDTNSFPCH